MSQIGVMTHNEVTAFVGVIKLWRCYLREFDSICATFFLPIYEIMSCCWIVLASSNAKTLASLWRTLGVWPGRPRIVERRWAERRVGPARPSQSAGDGREPAPDSSRASGSSGRPTPTARRPTEAASRAGGRCWGCASAPTASTGRCVRRRRRPTTSRRAATRPPARGGGAPESSSSSVLCVHVHYWGFFCRNDRVSYCLYLVFVTGYCNWLPFMSRLTGFYWNIPCCFQCYYCLKWAENWMELERSST